MQKTNRLIEKYHKEVLPRIMAEFGIKNLMAAPRVEKIVVNAGVGKLSKNQAGLEALRKDLAVITGQNPSIRFAKKSIAAFGVREGDPVGLSVTLRGVRMYAFLDKLFSITLPRLRDFRGVKSNSFDQFGNYTLGLAEHTVFPEIDLAKAAPSHGLEITIVTSSNSVEASKRLLELLGCPFQK